MKFNLQKYAPVFREETESLLERIESNLGKFQRTGNLEQIHEIKRCIHTIKGSSAAMELEELSRRSHQLEEEIDRLTVGEGRNLGELARVLYEYSEEVKKTIRGNFFGAASRHRSTGEFETVKIQVEKLDNILNIVGEVLNLHIQIKEISRQVSQRADCPPEVMDIVARVDEYERYVNQLQSLVMEVRMVPLDNVLNRFQQFVHNYALEAGKKAQLQIRGAGTELDKKIAGLLIEPLTHLVRNAIDHGIETEQERKEAGKSGQGLIRIAAFQVSSQVILEIEDDGRGIDAEKVRVSLGKESAADLTQEDLLEWISREGNSTASEVTEVSGRGIGMAAVRGAIERMGGSIQVFTRHGRGTLFTLRLPLTLAVTRALVVEVTPYALAVPLSSVVETMMVAKDRIFGLGKGNVGVRYRGDILPIVNEIEMDGSEEHAFLTVISDGVRKGVLAVGKSIKEQDIVIKSIQKDVTLSPMVSGVAILGDGTIAFLLNVQHVLSDRFRAEQLKVA